MLKRMGFQSATKARKEVSIVRSVELKQEVKLSIYSRADVLKSTTKQVDHVMRTAGRYWRRGDQMTHTPLMS